MRERDFYHLLRIFDGSWGVEITRVAVNQYGIPSSLIHRTSDERSGKRYPRDILRLEEAVELAHAQTDLTGVEVEAAQYVATWGTLRCDPLAPCIAVREGQENGETYIVKGKRLFRIDASRGAYSLSQELTPERRGRVIQRLAKSDQRLISLGGDAFAVAVPVND